MAVADHIAAARTRMAAALPDTCIVTADPESRRDRTFDKETLTYTDTETPDAVTVFEGACSVSTSVASRETSEGGRAVRTREIRAKLPADAEGIEVGHTLTVTASDGEPDLVDVPLKVAAVDRRSRAVTRTLTLEERR